MSNEYIFEYDENEINNDNNQVLSSEEENQNNNELNNNENNENQINENDSNENINIIEKIKNDYEQLLNSKNDEISNFINDLANENSDLKKENITFKKEKIEMENKIDIYERTFPLININYTENCQNESQNEINEKIKELENKYNEEKKNIENNFQEINNKYIKNKEEISNEELEKIFNDYQKQILNLIELKFNKEKSNIILNTQNEFFQTEKEYIKMVLLNEKYKILNTIKEIEGNYQKKISNLANNKFNSTSFLNNNPDLIKINELTFEKQQLLTNNYSLFNKCKEFSDLNNQLNFEKEQLDCLYKELSNSHKLLLKEKKILESKIETLNNKNENLFKQINELRQENIELKKKENSFDLKIQINESNYQKEIEILKEVNQTTKTELDKLLNNKDNIINSLTIKEKELEENLDKINNEYNTIKAEFDILKEENIKQKSELYSNNNKLKNLENLSSSLKEDNTKYEKENSNYINNISSIQNELLKLKEKNTNLEEENLKIKKINEINSRNIIELKSINETLSKQLKLVNESLNPLQLKQTSQNQEKQYEEILTKVNHENSSLKNQLEEFYAQLEEKQNLITQIYSKYNLYEGKTIYEKKNNNENEVIYLLKIIDNDMENLVTQANSAINLNEQVIENQNEIENLKNKIASLIKMKTSSLYNNYTSNITNLSSISQIQLYEKVIKYIHYLNIIHSLQDIKMSMKYEDDIKNILISNINEDDIDKINNNINEKLTELNNNIEDIKKNIENDSVYFEQRLKNLINIEDVKKCISEIQKQYESIISNLFESFLTYNASDKDTENIILLLKIPVNNYNNIIEESMGKIDNIVNYIKNWYDDINKEIGEKVDNAFEAVLNITNVNLDDDYKNNSKSNFGY
jgi:structural maintenance of chromosome 4